MYLNPQLAPEAVVERAVSALRAREMAGGEVLAKWQAYVGAHMAAAFRAEDSWEKMWESVLVQEGLVCLEEAKDAAICARRASGVPVVFHRREDPAFELSRVILLPCSGASMRGTNFQASMSFLGAPEALRTTLEGYVNRCFAAFLSGNFEITHRSTDTKTKLSEFSPRPLSLSGSMGLAQNCGNLSLKDLFRIEAKPGDSLDALLQVIQRRARRVVNEALLSVEVEKMGRLDPNQYTFSG